MIGQIIIGSLTSDEVPEIDPVHSRISSRSLPSHQRSASVFAVKKYEMGYESPNRLTSCSFAHLQMSVTASLQFINRITYDRKVVCEFTVCPRNLSMTPPGSCSDSCERHRQVH